VDKQYWLYKIEEFKQLGIAIGSVLWALAGPYIIPIADFLAITALLVFVDLITGLFAARHRKENIRSRGLFRTLEKVVVYFVAILSAQGMEQVFQLEFLYLTYLVSFAIASTEFISVIENVETITGIDVRDRISEAFKSVVK
jgi:phage-related holin